MPRFYVVETCDCDPEAFDSHAAAQAEAEEFARDCPGATFQVVQAVTTVELGCFLTVQAAD